MCSGAETIGSGYPSTVFQRVSPLRFPPRALSGTRPINFIPPRRNVLAPPSSNLIWKILLGPPTCLAVCRLLFVLLVVVCSLLFAVCGLPFAIRRLCFVLAVVLRDILPRYLALPWSAGWQGDTVDWTGVANSPATSVSCRQL